MSLLPARLGLTPGRAAAVAGLAALMVAVWAPQLWPLLAPAGSAAPSAQVAVVAGGEPVAEHPGQGDAASETSGQNATVGSDSVQAGAEPSTTNRGAMTVERAAAYDPFAPGPWSDAAQRLAALRRATPDGDSNPALDDSPDGRASRLAALRQTGLGMVLVSSAGRAAMIGDRTIREGDIVDGFRVLRIREDGVEFIPVEGGDVESLSTTGEAEP